MKKTILVLSADPQSFYSLKTLLQDLGLQVKFVQSVAQDISQSAHEIPATCLAILNHPPSIKLDRQELSLIKNFHKRGGSLLVASSGATSAEEGRASLEDLVSSCFGVKFDRNCIVRPNPYRHFHPREAMLEDFIVNRGLADAMRQHPTIGPSSPATAARLESLLQVKGESGAGAGAASEHDESPRIIYANGCSLSVDKRESTVMMTSSRWAIPSGRAICAFHLPVPPAGGGRAVILGSSALMSDEFLVEENNRSLICAIMDFIAADKSFLINASDARTATTADDKDVEPAIDALIDLPVSCLEVFEPLPDDASSLIDRRLFRIDGKLLPQVIRAYRDLNVQHEPLSLIKPHLDPSSGLNLEPATHGFLLSGLEATRHRPD